MWLITMIERQPADFTRPGVTPEVDPPLTMSYVWDGGELNEGMAVLRALYNSRRWRSRDLTHYMPVITGARQLPDTAALEHLLGLGATHLDPEGLGLSRSDVAKFGGPQPTEEA